jgi:uncharacterized membrane protein
MISEIKCKARLKLKENYWACVGWLFLASVLIGLISIISLRESTFDFLYYYLSVPRQIILWLKLISSNSYVIIFLFVFSIFVGNIIDIGTGFFALTSYRGEKAGGKELFQGFRYYSHALKGILWVQLWYLIWTSLLIVPFLLTLEVPGFFVLLAILLWAPWMIYKTLQYSFTKFILLDQPDLSPRQALRYSIDLTDGIKGKLIKTYLSFLDLWIFSAFTLGIFGIFFVNPYFKLTVAGIYEERKAEFIKEQEDSRVDRAEWLSKIAESE